MIPQIDGIPVPIFMYEVNKHVKTLGVHSCPAGDFGVDFKNIECKGILWNKRLKGRPVPPDYG